MKTKTDVRNRRHVNWLWKFQWKPQGGNNNYCLHLWEIWMPHLNTCRSCPTFRMRTLFFRTPMSARFAWFFDNAIKWKLTFEATWRMPGFCTSFSKWIASHRMRQKTLQQLPRFRSTTPSQCAWPTQELMGGGQKGQNKQQSCAFGRTTWSHSTKTAIILELRKPLRQKTFGFAEFRFPLTAKLRIRPTPPLVSVRKTPTKHIHYFLVAAEPAWAPKSHTDLVCSSINKSWKATGAQRWACP